jgi:hypothetical protein
LEINFKRSKIWLIFAFLFYEMLNSTDEKSSHFRPV